MANWHTISMLSLGFKVITFFLVSLLTTMSDEERYSAELCALNELSYPVRLTLDVHNVDEFKHRLARALGKSAANKEVERALSYLQLSNNERRPYSLRLLRNRLEANLSGLMGQNMANDIMHKLFPYKRPKTSGLTDINLIESRLDHLSHNLSGIAADVNQLRLHYRNTLQELPIAVCSLGPDNEILLWNKAMTELTAIPDGDITGSHLNNLPEPWGHLIDELVKSHQDHAHKQSINKKFTDHSGNIHWYRLHKTLIQGPSTQSIDGYVVLIEDITEIQMLEQKLVHSARLASIGRLAAGVAHEIGNPVTGIACLAQNLHYENDIEERQHTAQQILSQTDRINSIVQSLVTFAHSGKLDDNSFRPVDLYNVIEESIQLLSLQQHQIHIQFINQVGQDIRLWGDSQRLIQVFINLLTNARDASPNNSTITLSADSDSKFVYIYILDEGKGIAREHIDKILEPFFTTKDAGQGTGLGLSLVYSIIKEHSGFIEIKTPIKNNQGSCFILKLPVYSEVLATEPLASDKQLSQINQANYE
jgi:PAS domain S-box-containing protein